MGLTEMQFFLEYVPWLKPNILIKFLTAVSITLSSVIYPASHPTFALLRGALIYLGIFVIVICYRGLKQCDEEDSRFEVPHPPLLESIIEYRRLVEASADGAR